MSDDSFGLPLDVLMHLLEALRELRQVPAKASAFLNE
jgi:hypothetical protein